MALSPITLRLVATGGGDVQKTLLDIANAATAAGKAVNAGGVMAATAWSPAIAAAKQYQAEQKKVGAWKVPANSGGAAQAWNPYIAAARQYQAEQKKVG